MRYDSRPDNESKPPTYREVVKYAVEAGLIGKVSTVKFYDYYNRNGFIYKGYIFDWKTKLHEWARRQRSPVTVTAVEYEAMNAIEKEKKTEQSRTIAKERYQELLKAVEQI